MLHRNFPMQVSAPGAALSTPSREALHIRAPRPTCKQLNILHYQLQYTLQLPLPGPAGQP